MRTLPAHSPSPVSSTSLNLTSISTIFRFDIFNELMPCSPCSDSINTFSTHLLPSPHSYISYPPPLAPLSYTLTNQPLQHPSTPLRDILAIIISRVTQLFLNSSDSTITVSCWRSPPIDLAQALHGLLTQDHPSTTTNTASQAGMPC